MTFPARGAASSVARRAARGAARRRVLAAARGSLPGASALRPGRGPAAALALLLLAAVLPAFAGGAPAAATPGGTRPDAIRVAPAPDGSPGADAEDDELREETDRPGLEITIDSLTPSAVPRRGRVTVTGRLTNASHQAWTNLQASLVVSATPLRSTTALAEAAVSDPDLVIGQRLLGEGQFVNLDDLEPGESTDYRLSIPRRDLPISGEPGVYWLAVHVLGTDAEGNRDGVADARTRTFLPLVPPASRRGSRAAVKTAVVVPVRQQVIRRSGGAVGETADWDDLLADDGRLGRLLALAEAAPTMPLTWLVDPAVLDAAARLAAGNPGFNTGPTADPATGDDPSAPAAPEDQASPTGPDGAAEAPVVDPEVAERADHAQDWLDRFRDALDSAPLLALPYADPDLAAAWRHRHLDLVGDAIDHSGRALEELGMGPAPIALAPIGGLLPSRALAPLGALLAEASGNSTLLLSDEAAPQTQATSLAVADQRVLLSDSGASSGGPNPESPHDLLSVRQRVLAEAALRVDGVGTEELRGPLVVQLPDRWDPGAGDPATLAEGLDHDWLDLTSLRSATTDRSLDERDATDLAYPRAARRAELPVRNLRAAAEVRTAGRTLGSLLLLNDTVAAEIDRAALAAASSGARTVPSTPLSLARATSASLRGLLGNVRIEGPEFVTMSSGEGHFAVTLINDLEEPVRVAIRPSTDDEDELTITAPDPLELGGGARVSLRLGARSSGFGVSEVRLIPATVDGAELPEVTTVSVRRSQVGIVIWIVMGLGAAVLVVALVVRVVRRRRDRAPEDLGTDSPDGTR